MPDKGFAIRCPHCGEWNVQKELVPSDVALDSAHELTGILKDLEDASARGEADTFSHPKLWRCKKPHWECPASFEAFVCRSEKEAFEFLKAVKSWSLKRDFRLYKADCRNRWEGKYYGVLFCTQPVPRQRDIELEQLMDRELLSRTILGVSYEINAPLTVFAANIFKPRGKSPLVYWMPIEAYSQGRLLAPQRFNTFCSRCREIIMKKLEQEFLDAKISPKNCPEGLGEDYTCAGRKAACLHSDWNHCPAFIEERKRRCPCYNSDLQAIGKVQEKWWSGQPIKTGIHHNCGASFVEIAFPVIVHDHLSGVAMTGQVFFDPHQITDVRQFVAQWEILEEGKGDLRDAREALICEEKQLRTNGDASFFVTEEELGDRISIVYQNTKRITEAANARYRDLRGRSEAAFRQEILGLIQDSVADPETLPAAVLALLKRMADYWAFKGAFLGTYSYETKDIRVVGYTWNGKGQGFGIPGRKQMSFEIAHRQTHPCAYLCLTGQPPPRHTRLWHLLPLIEEIMHDSGFHVLQGECEFGVLVPFLDQVYAFLFASRDEPAVCILERREPRGISKLCQDAILETCTQAVYEVGEIQMREAEKRRVQAERLIETTAIAADLAHKLGNRTGIIQLIVSSIEKEASRLGVRSSHKLMRRLNDLKGATKRLTETANDLKERDYVGHPAPLNISLLVAQAMRQFELENIMPGVSVLGEVPRHIPKAIGIKNMLINTIVNMLQNAAQAGANTIRITALDNSKASGMIDLVISDNGKGMSKKELERVFQPVEKSKKDTGFHFGLCVSKFLIVNMMKGDISAKSEPGKGTIFSLSLQAS